MAAAMVFGSTFGCSTTIRSMTARGWVAPPGQGESEPVAKNSPPPAEGAPAEGAPAEGAAPAPAAPQAQADGLKSQYYVTYWEGHCKPVLGCGAGESHVKRCRVAADNSVTCTDEAAANKALNPD